MAGSVNKVILVGNLGKDPEVRAFGDGGKVANFTLATSESWRDKASGERRDKTEWHRVSVLNENLVKLTENYLRKGSKVYVEGQLQTREWTDKDGVKKYTTEVVLGRFRGELTMLDGRNDGRSGGDGEREEEGGGYRASSARPSSGGSARSGGGAPAGGYGNADLDDDIPF